MNAPALRQGDHLFCQSAPYVQKAWDNSSLSLFKACPRKYQLAIIEGWRPRLPSAALEYGSLYHAGIEHYAKARALGQDHDEAQLVMLEVIMALTTTHMYVAKDTLGQVYAASIDKGDIPLDPDLTVTCEPRFWQSTDSRRTRQTLVRSLIWYSEQFKDDAAKTLVLPNGSPAVELSFRLELSIRTPDGDPYLWCGHIDRIVTYGGQKYVLECKHTVSTLSSYYFDRFSPNSQVSGYNTSCNVVFHEPVAGTIIDAAQIAVGFTRFQRGIASRTKDQLEEWLRGTEYWIQQAEWCADTFQDKDWPMQEESCGNYGGCQFRGACSKAPGARQAYLEAEFIREPWNPLKNRGGEDGQPV